MNTELQNSEWHKEARQAWGDGNVEMAEFLFTALLKGEPDHPAYLIGKSHCRFAMKDYEHALGLARHAFGASHNTGNREARKTASMLIGASCLALENPQGSRILEKIKSDHPHDAQDTSYKIALLLARAEKFEAALPYVEDTFPEANPEHYLLASEIYYGLGREFETDFAFKQACELSNGTTGKIVSYLRASFTCAQLTGKNDVEGQFAVTQLQRMVQTAQPA